MLSGRFHVAPEVRAACEDGRAVVALESTIISHGLPYPRNIALARSVEREIRECGAIPATIAVVDGVVRVGLADDDLERLARARDVVKVSRRDLPVVVGLGGTGGTTVAATMSMAAMGGIRVFATGGIGGVHRGAERTMDISADLHELARSDVLVVCAGAKAILDLPLTLEVLETLGVPVLGYGTNHVPAFYTPDSGLAVEARVDSPAQVAAIAQAKWDLGLHGGILVAVPVPADAAISREEVEAMVAAALDAAAQSNMSGKRLTPFVLAYLHDATGGRTLDANSALMRNNARVAAGIARALVAQD